MLLDSGNIISDQTFCTQSQITVEKFPNFWQNISAFPSLLSSPDEGDFHQKIILAINKSIYLTNGSSKCLLRQYEVENHLGLTRVSSKTQASGAYCV